MPTTQKPHCLWEEDTGCWDIKNNSSTAKCITMRVGYACVLSHFSCPSLFNPLNCSPLGSSVHEIPQARVLEWIAMLSSRGSFQPRDLTQVSLIAGRFFTSWATWEALSILEVKWSKIHSVMSNSLWPHELYSSWNSPGQNTGMGSLSLLQGIFPTWDPTQVSHTAGGFFTSWATREAQMAIE